MRIKVYILTYNYPEAVDQNLNSLFDNMGDKPEDVTVDVHVINNHSNFHIAEKFVDKVTVLRDILRPDWSCGHSARSWNAALMHGFRDLNNPDCDILINIQDDMFWEADWIKHVIEVHKTYNFFTCSWGDAFCSYTAEAVKKIGIWDERFCTLGYLEADYFLRALIYNKDGSSINDTGPCRVVNRWMRQARNDERDFTNHQYGGAHTEWERGNIANRRNYDMHSRVHSSVPYYDKTMAMFRHKWPGISPEFWPESLVNDPHSIRPACPTYMYYPYFEKDIYELDKKGYFQL